MTKKLLTPRARRALAFIVEYKTGHDGNSPALREIGVAIGVKSSSMIDYYLRELERAGLIRREVAMARAIELVGGQYRWENPAVVV